MARSTTTATKTAPRQGDVGPRKQGAHDSQASNGTACSNSDASIEEKYKDFFWTYTEEPHRTRRLAIIKLIPRQALSRWLVVQVTKLCGPEPLTKYVVLFVVSLQLLLAHLLRETPFWSWKFWAVAYVFGATANQNLFLAIHEISHNLASRSPTANRLLAIFANLPIAIPYSASFRPYHLTHHKSLGVDGLDADLPPPSRPYFLDTLLGKAFFCTFQIIFYAIRPMTVFRVPLTWVHAVNILAQAAFDYALITSPYFGTNSVLYLLLSSFLAGSLHPLAGHFIAEHYVYEHVDAAARDPANGVPVPETFSYYGPLNVLAYNVGLHNEHHDFPRRAVDAPARLHALAREFYADLPQHRSWSYALWRFIWDDSVGIRCRVKRKEGGRVVGGAAAAGAAGAAGAKQAGWTENEIQA